MADHSLHSPNRRIGRKRKSDVYAPFEGDGLGPEDAPTKTTKRQRTVKDEDANALGALVEPNTGKLISPKKKIKDAVAEDDDCVVQTEEALPILDRRLFTKVLLAWHCLDACAIVIGWLLSQTQTQPLSELDHGRKLSISESSPMTDAHRAIS
jgi:hypothetical protein